MSESRPQPPRRPGPVFRPRFSISLFYLAGFALLFMLLMIAPSLLEVLDALEHAPPGEAAYDEAMAEAAAIAQANTRPYVALLLSLLVTGIGGYFEVLPGLREG